MQPINHKPIIDAAHLELKYQTGFKRDNIQSRVVQLLKRKQKKSYLWALNDLSFKAFAGDIIGVIGGNGEGKTTLCRVIAGALKPDNGTIKVRGQVSALLALGTGFNVQLSGRQNIYLNSLMLGRSKKETRDLVDEIWTFSGLGRFIDEPVKNYSSGMRARLAFSTGVMMKPDILILDEALSTGDNEFSQRAGKKLRSVINHSRVVIVVTHNLSFVERFCTRGMWINKGRVEKDGTPGDVVALYKDYVQNNKIAVPKTVNLTRPNFLIKNQAVVQVSNLGVNFRLQAHKDKNFWPLKDIKFQVKKGEIIGVIGRNGEGKTTLCRVLAGIIKPDRGKVFVDGTTTALLTFGAGFNVQLTGRDNIYLNGLMLGIPKKRLKQITNEIITFAELGSYIDQPVKNYSNGMRSKLGFSIASMLEPDIFIIDEALNAGDMAFYQKANTRIQQLIEKSKAVLIVTHNLSFVKQVCSRAIWIKNGAVHQDGSCEKVISAYKNDLTAIKTATQPNKK